MKWLGWCLWMMSGVVLASPWERVSSPSAAPAQAVGSYANGCLIGAQALPLNGLGYQVLRSQNRRNFAHPSTISFVEQLSQQTYAAFQRHLLIADMSLPRGGRFSSGHSSHQTGLDIDVWLQLDESPWTEEQLKQPKAQSLVDLDYYALKQKRWQPEHFQLLKLTATRSEVARIFVHPVIKKQLCDQETANSDWLQKVRPWWGHHYHMHVRLHCPEGSSDCREQKLPPPGNGCGSELTSWFPNTVPVKKPEKTTTIKPKPRLKRIMPPKCEPLIVNVSSPN
ncbi:penicillin-insensitive murein endopeptidase [Vibrio sp. FNV 38]|nr:penicillin-insensitive murein endopeptidase [Vibrio sp. FNV 38]